MALTGLISVVEPGSMEQIIIASTISLAFLVMHARCWPFKVRWCTRSTIQWHDIVVAMDLP